MGNVILLQKCLLCERGCVRGLSIRGHLICPACESLLVNLACDDPAYDALRLALKKICRPLIRNSGLRARSAPGQRVAPLYRSW